MNQNPAPPPAPETPVVAPPPVNPVLAGVLQQPADPDTFTWFKG